MAGCLQQPRGDIGIAAIVARPGQDKDRTAPGEARHRARHGGAGTLHHVQLGLAPEQRLLGGAHPGGGDDRCAGRNHLPGPAPRTVAGRR